VTCQRVNEIDVAAFLVEPGLPEWAPFRAHYPSCPDCSAVIATWARLEQSLRSPGGAGGESGGTAHPEPAVLARYAGDPAALGAEGATLSAHLAACPSCRTELRALQRFDWRRIAAPASALREPAARNLGERLAAWLGLGSPRALAPVALGGALALGIGLWVASRGAPRPEPAPPPPIASTLPEVEPPAAPGEPTPSEVVARSEAPAPAPPSSAEAVPVVPAEEPPPQVAEAAPAPKPPPPPEPVPAPPAQAPPAPQPLLLAAVAELPPPSYARPPAAERLGGELGSSVVRSGAGGPRVELQAPPHVGLTARAAPRLWWSVSAPTEHALVITLADDRAIDPLLRVERPGPHARGLASIDLARSRVSLEPGVVYRWFVTLLVDPAQPSRNPVSSAAIQRLAPGDPRLAGLADVPPERRGHELAQRGVWYDAFDFFAALAQAHPQVVALQRHRDALMSTARASDRAPAP
jgi:hypothetical protein